MAGEQFFVLALAKKCWPAREKVNVQFLLTL
jgi:hypothetical protein